MWAVGLAALWCPGPSPPAAAPAAPDTAAAAAFGEDDRRLCLESFDHVWTTIRDRHFDPTLGGIDWQAVRDSLRPRVEQARTAHEARSAMRTAVGILGQSHFQIIPADALKARGRPPGQGSPGGTTGMDVRVVDGKALVVKVEPRLARRVAGRAPRLGDRAGRR